MNGNRIPDRVEVAGNGVGLVSQAGAVLLVQTARAVGLDRGLAAELKPWRKPRAVHDPGKVLLDLATSVALGGDCLADVAVLRAQPALFGPVASDPTVSRLIDALAGDVEAALAALRAARAGARSRSWARRRPVGEQAGQLVVDLDATIVVAHSEKEQATPTFKRTFGFHPLLAFLDHGPEGSGEPLAGVLRGGRANANNAADHVQVLDLALQQLPETQRTNVLVRGDTGAGPRPSCTTSPAWACTTRSGSPAPCRSRLPSSSSPGKPGPRPMTRTASRGRGRRSPS